MADKGFMSAFEDELTKVASQQELIVRHDYRTPMSSGGRAAHAAVTGGLLGLIGAGGGAAVGHEIAERGAKGLGAGLGGALGGLSMGGLGVLASLLSTRRDAPEHKPGR